MINESLLKEGYAKIATYPPDVKYQNIFLAAEQEARNNSRGLWGNLCNPTKTEEVEPTIPQPIIQNPSASYTCNCSKTCTQMSSCEEAYYQLNTCGCLKRDGDDDGIPCESICN
jgi:micrococcal nuclease